MPWTARACSGDVATALLQPQQVLVAHEDAARHCVKQLDLVRVNLAPLRSVLLECVVDRGTGGAALAGGRIQLHPWALDVCGQLEDTWATLEKVERAAAAASWRLSLSLQTKFPPAATSGSAGVGRELGDSRTDLLPESVRRGQIDLEGAIRRQLRAAGTLRAPREGQLVPVRLLGDTYVFRVDGAVKVSGKSGETLQVIVNGWSEATDAASTEREQTAELTRKVEALSLQEDLSRTAGSSYESQLNARLWHAGFAGYTAFVQDVLLNLALVLKAGNAGEVEQIGSHGILISGVDGVGKSQALKALQRELVREKIGTWWVDGMSLLMGAESPVFPTAYEYLTHELEQKFPDVGSLLSTNKATAPSCVGAVLIDDLDVLFQSADGRVVDGSDTQLPQLGSALLRLIDELSSRSAALVVVGTTASADINVPLAAKRTGRFEKVLDLVVPTEQSRREILRRHLIGLPLRSDQESPIDDFAENLASRLASLTGGYVAKDLVRICRNAAAKAFSQLIDDAQSRKPSVGWAELLHAQQQVKPSQLRELNVASPGAPVDGNLKFAGYAAVQKQLFDFVSWKFHPTDAMNVRLHQLYRTVA
ncbi:unnamed protein product [Phytophthora fragariaefolia]|uniref:Unnamed protein product n=1 Tax=Phytophthora fragariaefolia TaxID=1490495 RepID=A0A9W6U9Z6_9STRA|nr:unnamed protein product [Phytophthora fragariaefolia]